MVSLLYGFIVILLYGFIVSLFHGFMFFASQKLSFSDITMSLH